MKSPLAHSICPINLGCSSIPPQTNRKLFPVLAGPQLYPIHWPLLQSISQLSVVLSFLSRPVPSHHPNDQQAPPLSRCRPSSGHSFICPLSMMMDPPMSQPSGYQLAVDRWTTTTSASKTNWLPCHRGDRERERRTEKWTGRESDCQLSTHEWTSIYSHHS